jgi:hypothetical protein
LTTTAGFAQSGHELEHLLRIAGLDQVVIEAHLARDLPVGGLLPHPGDGDQERAAQVGEGVANRLRRAVAADPGNRDVEDHRIRAKEPDRRQHFGAIQHPLHDMALGLEEGAQRLDGVPVVVRDQDSQDAIDSPALGRGHGS